jgi:outer membrane protein assembly factor BamA
VSAAGSGPRGARRYVVALLVAAWAVPAGADAAASAEVADHGSGVAARADVNADRPGTAVTPPGVPGIDELAARGATIGAIEIHVQNIFDTADPRESAWFYRAANALHIHTRENTVREQLLFAGGEPLSAQRVAETERILRGRQYLNDAWIVPVRYDASANVVDLAVTVRDVWTLNPGISFNREGGENSTRFEIEEQNLFGRGIEVSVGRSGDVDRTSTILKYRDPNLFGRWLQADAEYSDNSDGRVTALSLQRPFYALDTRAAYGVSAYDGTRVVSRYDRGLVVDQFNEDAKRLQVYGGRSSGLRDGWVQRWFAGWRYEDAAFAPRAGLPPPTALPPDRKLSYPWVGWQLVEDRYRKASNLDLIGRTEDVYLGRSAYVELGWADPAFGADRKALLARAETFAGWAPSSDVQLQAQGSASGRLEDGEARNVVVAASGRYYHRVTARRSWFAQLQGATTHELDPERQLLLGGEEGLRGYPLRFQGGDSSALLTLEHRVYTDWYPFRLVRFGTATFFDVGRTWGRSFVGTEPYGLLKDVGFGLRFGNVRSGLGNVLHVDFSYALDAEPGVKRFEVTVETRSRF